MNKYLNIKNLKEKIQNFNTEKTKTPFSLFQNKNIKKSQKILEVPVGMTLLLKIPLSGHSKNTLENFTQNYQIPQNNQFIFDLEDYTNNDPHQIILDLKFKKTGSYKITAKKENLEDYVFIIH